MKKTRVDELLTRQGLAESRSKAQAFIGAGEVYTRAAGRTSDDSWEPVVKPSQTFPDGQEFQIRSKTSGDVGRGTQKLRGALKAWPQISVQGVHALDIGASTGGFTQVLLEHGATDVVALDVGTNQLHERLRSDPRVISIEQQHVLKCDEKFWAEKRVPLPFDLAVTDLSFISLEKVIPHAAMWIRPGGNWILLVKPQFELDRSHLHKGIVKDEKSRQEAVQKIRDVVKGLGPRWLWKDLIESPIQGGDGNVEYLLWLSRLA